MGVMWFGCSRGACNGFETTVGSILTIIPFSAYCVTKQLSLRTEMMHRRLIPAALRAFSRMGISASRARNP